MAAKKTPTKKRSTGRRVTAWMKKEQSQELIGVAVGGAAAPMIAKQLAGYLPGAVPPGVLMGAGGAMLATRGRGLARGLGLALLAYGAQGIGEQLGSMMGDESGALIGAGLSFGDQAMLQQAAERRARAYLAQQDEPGYLTYAGGDEAGYLATPGGRFVI